MIQHKTITYLIQGAMFTFLGFISWIIYSANTGQMNPFFLLVQQIPYGDKIGHCILFGLLTLVVNYCLNFKQLLKTKLLLGTVIVFIFAIVEELSQFYIPLRTLDIVDLIAGTFGIVLFDLISRSILKRKP